MQRLINDQKDSSDMRKEQSSSSISLNDRLRNKEFVGSGVSGTQEVSHFEI